MTARLLDTDARDFTRENSRCQFSVPFPASEREEGSGHGERACGSGGGPRPF